MPIAEEISTVPHVKIAIGHQEYTEFNSIHYLFVLFRCFCQSYDMKPHSTKIFANIVNALGSFIQSLFVNPVVERQSSLSSE